MAAVYAITATGTNQVARPVKARNFLGIYNQSATATVYVAFDMAALAAATAGQITLLPISGANVSWFAWGPGDGQALPSGAINMIASAGGTPVTIIEG
jgi:hypothetical protein